MSILPPLANYVTWSIICSVILRWHVLSMSNVLKAERANSKLDDNLEARVNGPLAICHLALIKIAQTGE